MAYSPDDVCECVVEIPGKLTQIARGIHDWTGSLFWLTNIGISSVIVAGSLLIYRPPTAWLAVIAGLEYFSIILAHALYVRFRRGIVVTLTHAPIAVAFAIETVVRWTSASLTGGDAFIVSGVSLIISIPVMAFLYCFAHVGMKYPPIDVKTIASVVRSMTLISVTTTSISVATAFYVFVPLSDDLHMAFFRDGVISVAIVLPIALYYASLATDRWLCASGVFIISGTCIGAALLLLIPAVVIVSLARPTAKFEVAEFWALWIYIVVSSACILAGWSRRRWRTYELDVNPGVRRELPITVN
jgi:hypothetical protein